MTKASLPTGDPFLADISPVPQPTLASVERVIATLQALSTRYKHSSANATLTPNQRVRAGAQADAFHEAAQIVGAQIVGPLLNESLGEGSDLVTEAVINTIACEEDAG